MIPGKPFVLKKLLSKIKIHNFDSLKFDRNEDMKKAILEKNIELRTCLENSEKSLFELLFIVKNQNGTPNYAIVKVTPDVRNLILTTGKIFIEMSSHCISDHFHVEQCYKCQGYGHRSASKLCPLRPVSTTSVEKAFFVCFIALFCARFNFNRSLQSKINKRDKECSFPLQAWKKAFFVCFIDFLLRSLQF